MGGVPGGRQPTKVLAPWQAKQHIKQSGMCILSQDAGVSQEKHIFYVEG